MADPNMTFDLNLKDADRHQALDDFFQQAGRAVIFDDEPSHVISVRAADLSFRDAVELLLPEGFQAVEIDGIYHIRRVR
ncbi:MAG: hypothetical protein ACYDCO_09440 [Armatimonadota bacterium]